MHESSPKKKSMDITWHGNSCFSIKTKTAKAVINPYKEGTGLKLPSLKANVVILTHNQEGNDNSKAVGDEPKIIDWPGEYEISGIVLTVKPVPGKKGTLFTLVGDGIRVCYLEDVGNDLNEELIEAIGDTDILIVPVGGDKAMSPEIAHKIIEEVEPRCVIPMNYKVDGLTTEVGELAPFQKLVGVQDTQPEAKFTVQSRGSLSADKTEYIFLEPQV